MMRYTDEQFEAVIVAEVAPAAKSNINGTETPGERFEIPEDIPQGDRHNTIYRFLRSQKARKASLEVALAGCHVLNETECKPPLDKKELDEHLRRVWNQPNSPEFAAGRDDGATKPPPLTEAGDAECFAAMYQDSVRYDHHRGRWLVADEDSGIWIPDPVERLTQLAIKMARKRQLDAIAIEDKDRKKEATSWAIRGEGRGRIHNALALARSVPPIADKGLEWDQHPFLLGAQNGVVDLRTGEFRKAVADDRVTMRVRIPYDAAARCPLWLQTLNDIFAPSDLFTAEASRALIDFMQRAVGYSITGDCSEECCFFAWGEGGNGKGTVMNTLGWLFGDYTDDMPYSTLEQSVHGGGIPNDVAKLEGKRFITCSEVNTFTLNETRLKALTGRDPMTARFLNREFFTFIPVGKIWIATNNKPKIVGTDDGIWRRIHLIPFTRKFEGKSVDKRLKDKLRLELPGILNWVVVGARMWLDEGLNPPESVTAATKTYRLEANPLTPFIEACCVLGESCRVQAAQAFAGYEKFCNDTSVDKWERLSNKAFFKLMGEMFRADDRRQKFYKGIGLKGGPVDPTFAQTEREPGVEG